MRLVPLRAATLSLFLAAPQALAAQSVSLAGGYSSMPGRIGALDSDHGIVGRLGVDLKRGARLAWSLEGGLQALNESRTQTTTTCSVSGVIKGCHFDSRDKDTGWSLTTILRYAPSQTAVRPYLLIGVGALSIRTKQSSRTVDDAGAPLPNFDYHLTTSDGALQLHLGGGISGRPTGSPVSLFAEARATRLFYNYSGGLQWGWNPTIVGGVRFGG